MKKLIFFNLIALSLAIGCTNGDELVGDQDNLPLVSPSGKELAQSNDGVIDLILADYETVIDRASINLESIRYEENEAYSLGIVDFVVEDQNQSMLVVLDLDSDYLSLIDDSGLRFVETSSNSNITIDGVDIGAVDSDGVLSIPTSESNESDNQGRLGRITINCSGSCCGWSQPGSDHFHCGCSSSVIISTGDGCVARILPASDDVGR